MASNIRRIVDARLVQLVILSLTTWTVGYARFMLGPLQETLSKALNLDDNHIALIQGTAVAVPMALAAIPLGLLSDRVSRARLYLLFIGLALIAPVIQALAHSFIVLFAARCLTGLAIAWVLVTAYAMGADLFPPETRGRAYIVMALGEMGGPPAAFAVGGLLLTAYGTLHPIAGMDDWRLALLSMCVPLLPIWFLLFALREPRVEGRAAESPPLAHAARALWEYRRILVPLLVARITVWVADGAVVVWGAPLFARRFDLPPSQIGAIMAMVMLVGGLAGPAIGGGVADYCQKRGGPRRTMSVMALLSLAALPFALFALLPQSGWVIFAMTAFVTIGFTINLPALTVGTIVIPSHLRGSYLAVTITTGALFSIGVAPLAVSLLATLMGGPNHLGPALSVVCALSSLLGAVVFIIGRSHIATASKHRPALGRLTPVQSSEGPV